MYQITALVSILVALTVTGCSKKPAEADIDMGPRAPAPVSGQATDDDSPVAAPLELTAIAAGEGKTSRIIESCNVEQVNGQAFAGSAVTVAKGMPVAVSGWVIDSATHEAAELRLVNVTDASTYAVAIKANVAREDVATSFNADPTAVKPGFNVVFNAANLRAGDYRLQVVVPSAELGAAACDNGRVISLTD